MPIIKLACTDNYTTIPNETVRDISLSWKARGLHHHLLSLPPNWKITEAYLVTQSPGGITQIQSGIKELIEAGYIIRQQSRNAHGGFGEYFYFVFATPEQSQTLESQQAMKASLSIGFLVAESPISENLISVNQVHIKDIDSNEIQEKKYFNGEVENFEVSDQTGTLPDSENSPDQDQISSLTASSLRSGFVSRNENNSQQAAKPSKSGKKPSLVKIMEAIPIKTRRVSQAIAEIFIEEDIYDWGLISAEIWEGIKTWPNYQNGDRTPEQKVKHYLSGITRLGKCDQIAEALRQACEAVRAKKHPIESKSDFPTNLTSEQKIALKQIHLAMKQGNRSLAQQIASEHGLN